MLPVILIGHNGVNGLKGRKSREPTDQERQHLLDRLSKSFDTFRHKESSIQSLSADSRIRTGFSPNHSSSSSSSTLRAGLLSILAPNAPEVVLLGSSEFVPRTSLIRPDDSAIRRRSAFSSAVETLARCFFNGLPIKLSADSAAGADGSDIPGAVDSLFGGVVARSSAGGVVPEAVVPLGLSTLRLLGSAEC